MGIPWDDVVVIQHGKDKNDPTVVTVNCPDKAGLGCDLCRITLEFGLRIKKADISTDGRWCYIVFWVVPNPSSLTVDWGSLKTRLLSACPSCLLTYHLNQQLTTSPSPPPIYLLKVWLIDQKGLLHDINEILCNLELLIQRVKVMPTPDGRALDMFFINDGMELLHTKKRQDYVCEFLKDALGDRCISTELQLAGPEYGQLQGISSLPPAFAEELFSSELLDKGSLHPLSQDMAPLKKPTVMVDNSLSPAHTLLQIECVDQKGLCYDIMRISKDSDIKVAHGRFSSSAKGFRSIDLLVQQKDGKKIMDPESQKTLCSCLKEEMLHPLRVIIVNRGPDTELLVANPVELSGKGRPRVFYDVTLTLKALGVMIFSAEIVRHSTQERQWEVYRFLLDESRDFPLTSSKARSQIVDKVRRTLMGW
ncbi:ACT domain-containing protein ACR9 [Arachis stenosperma]|uniref:ACT domain-containing protein ACR9 n=1 Tax=Arachis stenosperma TaxID=217475 RepID=UPI0025ABB2C8|nr:ACT domain-containing protein ACR9 [Arachis stenosperma]